MGNFFTPINTTGRILGVRYSQGFMRIDVHNPSNETIDLSLVAFSTSNDYKYVKEESYKITASDKKKRDRNQKKKLESRSLGYDIPDEYSDSHWDENYEWVYWRTMGFIETLPVRPNNEDDRGHTNKNIDTVAYFDVKLEPNKGDKVLYLLDEEISELKCYKVNCYNSENELVESLIFDQSMQTFDMETLPKEVEITDVMFLGTHELVVDWVKPFTMSMYDIEMTTYFNDIIRQEYRAYNDENIPEDTYEISKLRSCIKESYEMPTHIVFRCKAINSDDEHIDIEFTHVIEPTTCDPQRIIKAR